MPEIVKLRIDLTVSERMRVQVLRIGSSGVTFKVIEAQDKETLITKLADEITAEKP